MVAEKTRHVMIFGLGIKDEPRYQRYREAMAPIMESYGGAFGYDLVVSRVVKSETEGRIDRVFTMVFPERSAAERFFSDPAYKSVRAEHFEPAVRSVAKIGAYDERAPVRG